jgi:23S rRNA (pseudouridine1915-N3)-methyltransferase
MRLVLAWVGRTRDFRLQQMQEEYLARIEKFVPVEVITVKESRSAAEAQRAAEQLLERKIPEGSTVIALDEKGREFTSAALAGFVGELQVRGTRVVCFVLGGPSGLTDSLRERADHVMSLSRLTWTHEMSRVLLLEQLYRAFTILRGYPYHK